MDFDNAMDKAQELKSIALRMETVADGELQSAFTGIRNSWSGENAEKYLQKGTAVSERIQSTSQALRKAAETIEQIARNTYEAEMKAIRIAKVFSGGGSMGSR